MKIIIENQTDLAMDRVLDYIGVVIRNGKISETSKGKQYCFLTTFKGGYRVSADKNKKSDRFVFWREK